MSELPDGWETVILEDIALINPRHPSNLDTSLDVSFVPMPGVSDITPSFNFTEVKKLEVVKKGFTHFAEDDVLMAKITPSMENGKAAIARNLANGLGCGTTELHVIRPQGGIFSEFIYHYIHRESFRKEAAKNMTGTAGQLRVPAEYIRATEIPLPPLNEQRRIVAKLEKLLAKCQASQQRLDKIPSILKRFRQAILAAACSGRLTADWRDQHPDVEPAWKLVEKIQVEREKWYEQECVKAKREGKSKPKDQTKNKRSRNTCGEMPDIPETWTIPRLEDISYLVTDGTHKTPKYQETGTPFLSVKNVRPFLIRDEDTKFISQEEHLEISARCNPEKGDILYTKVGATFGYAALNQLEYPFSIFVSLALIKPVSPYFSGDYAEVVINSEIVFAQARERVSGIGTPDLHLIEIRDFRIPLPPLEEQKEIVQRVQKLFKLADQIEARYQKVRAWVDKLPQAILAKAFRGEMVPQDPNDEPASVLLERIQAARAQQKATAKGTKQGKGKTTRKGKGASSA